MTGFNQELQACKGSPRFEVTTHQWCCLASTGPFFSSLGRKKDAQDRAARSSAPSPSAIWCVPWLKTVETNTLEPS